MNQQLRARPSSLLLGYSLSWEPKNKDPPKAITSRIPAGVGIPPQRWWRLWFLPGAAAIRNGKEDAWADWVLREENSEALTGGEGVRKRECFKEDLKNLLAIPQGMWDLSSLMRDRTHTLCVGSEVITTGPPGKSQEGVLIAGFIITQVLLLLR